MSRDDLPKPDIHHENCVRCDGPSDGFATCASCEAKAARLQYFKDREARRGGPVTGCGYNLPMDQHQQVMKEAANRRERQRRQR